MLVNRTNLNSTEGILKEIEDSVELIKRRPDKLEEVNIRLRGCKHAIQIMALTYANARRLKSADALNHLAIDVKYDKNR